MWLAGAVWVFFAVGAKAQEEKGVQPGPEHEKFKKMVGTWDANVEAMGKKFKGTTTYHMGPGNLWLLEHFRSDFEGMKFEGMGAMTYDPAKKVYTHLWLDSMSTTPMISHGNFDDNNRMVMKGKVTKGDKTANVTMTSMMKGENTMIFTMSMPGEDGKAMQMMKITYTRQQKNRGN
jgi:hypothetical protein